jgi:hypothetical protein
LAQSHTDPEIPIVAYACTASAQNLLSPSLLKLQFTENNKHYPFKLTIPIPTKLYSPSIINNDSTLNLVFTVWAINKFTDQPKQRTLFIQINNSNSNKHSPSTTNNDSNLNLPFELSTNSRINQSNEHYSFKLTIRTKLHSRLSASNIQNSIYRLSYLRFHGSKTKQQTQFILINNSISN